MGKTLNYQWPYPDASLAPDGPYSMQLLGEAIDGTVKGIDGRLASVENSKIHAEFSGQYGVTSGQLWGPGPLSKIAEASLNAAEVTSPGNDKIYLPAGNSYNLHWRMLLLDTSNLNNRKSAANTTYAIIRDASGNELDSCDIELNRSSGTVSLTGHRQLTGGIVEFKFYTGTAGITLKSTIRIDRVNL